MELGITLSGDILSQSNKVFIVHVHDEHAKAELENMMHRLKLEPVVLHRRPDKGRTTIEKFEAESKGSGYALILLTSDDDCLLLDEETNQRKKVKRARQNVLLELGFFIGSLGRERVCAIYKKGVEIPSDISGVLYKQFEVGRRARGGNQKGVGNSRIPNTMYKSYFGYQSCVELTIRYRSC